MIENIIVLKGTIELQSPALIGCGKDDHTDIDLIKDSKGIPYIPATSLVGVLRDFIKPSSMNEGVLKEFWGYSVDENSQQSSITCDDLKAINGDAKQSLVEIRDGVAIDPKKSIVEDKSKYDFEIIKKGTRFSLYLEARCKQGRINEYSRFIRTIEASLNNGLIRVGAKTNSGLGRLKLKDDAIYIFDFKDKKDVLSWLKQDFTNKKPADEILPLNIKSNDFIIEASLRLKNSFIIRSYPSLPEDPDAVHITSADDYVIPGSSLKGALRSRALRIVNTIEKPYSIIENLFGDVYNDEQQAKQKGRKKGDAFKGRVTVEEVILPRFISELQTRIKVDRFTGGTIASALFETKPLFSSNNEDIKHLKITIKNCEPYEAGLMLLTLKDLFTGDLVVGGEKNIGRGVFEGLGAEISYDGKTISIDGSLSKLEQDKILTLNNLVKAFANFSGGGASC